MNSFLRALGIISLLALVLNLVGCASSDADLGYTRNGPESTSSDDAHGWGGGPVPTGSQ